MFYTSIESMLMLCRLLSCGLTTNALVTTLPPYSFGGKGPNILEPYCYLTRARVWLHAIGAFGKLFGRL